MKKKILALSLVFTLCVGLIPSTEISAAKKGSTYIVKRGDCIFDIATENDLSWREIAKQNNMKEPYTIYVGEKLQIPTAGSNKATQKEKKKETKKDTLANNKKKEQKSNEKNKTQDKPVENTVGYSQWALDDLLVADSYGIYPLTWYKESLKTPISKAKLEVLTFGLSDKLVKADGVTKGQTVALNLKDNMTVEEVLNVYYSILKGNDYSKDMGLGKRYSAIAYMDEYKIFTGLNGELSAKDICSVEQACVFASRIITKVYDTLDAASKGFLWEVKKGGNTAYLLGSIHIANNDIYPFSEKMLSAYQSSDALVVEVNMYDEKGSLAFANLVSYKDGTTLKNHISVDSYEKTIKTAALLGLTEDVVATLKPWYLSNLFSSYASMDTLNMEEVQKAASLGIDMNFMSNALIHQKPILEIEGYEMQGKLFDNFSAGLQEYLLNSSIDSLNKVKSGTQKDSKDATLINKWLEDWHGGDIESFKRSYNVQDEVLGDTFAGTQNENMKKYSEEYYNALLTNRDKGMADYINKLLIADGNKTYFVVVGSLHYLSDYSVLDILKEKGYDIKQVK